ncbi:MAG: DEAD/DEAH box helicase family protein [Clostridiales bacterium]
MNKIKLKFESNQEHQINAVKSVTDLFKGFSQEYNPSEFGNEVVPNIPEHYAFDESWIQNNLREVQDSNKLPQSLMLDADDGLMLEGVGFDYWRYMPFTIEMETGTGKTYVYLRTIHELKKLYGFRKYIIVVPSIAIYEGTIKTFDITREHFKLLYGNETVNLIKYDGQQISRVRDFAISPYITIMVITIDSFNSIKNNIYKATEKLPGELKPFEYIQATKPILILDESQNYLSPKSREALRTLKPLFAINYSATPKEKPNLIYRLSPVDAFKLNLVKKIQVEGVTEQYNLNDKNLSLIIEDISRRDAGIHAKVKAHVFQDGVKTEKVIILKQGDNLYKKTNNPAFDGFVVSNIKLRPWEIHFTNDSVLTQARGNSISLSKKEILRVQIEETIKYHFERQKLLGKQGIKVLSLFFIDRVANYVDEDGVIKILFDQAFNKLKKSDLYFNNYDASDVREGYFAKKTEKKGGEVFIDTPLDEERKTKEQKEAETRAYELIMRKKEQLLSFDEKVSFIFAHSALREGWDNPNVFQICTLNQTVSENRKRQEIGRGLRLCVNQNGDRVIDEGVNILTVVANEAYESYCSQLQEEYRETGDVAPQKPSHARRSMAKRNENVFKSKDFQQFWNKLCKQTDYNIKIDTPELIDQSIINLNSKKTQFPQSQIIISKGQFIITHFQLTLKRVKTDSAQIEVSVTDTEGNSNITTNWFKEGDDLARKSKDPRLNGYKIVQIIDGGEESVVHFGNGESLYFNTEITFDSEKGQPIGPISRMEAQTTYPVFNLIARTSRELGLTRPTILEVFKGMDESRKKLIFSNPEGFAAVFIAKFKESLANHIAEKIEYRLTSELFNDNLDDLFPSSKEYPQKELIAGSANSMYDVVQIDSDVEKYFVQNRLVEDDNDGKIICYFKFPPSFKIRIPKIIGNYNPDWGIIRLAEDGKTRLQLVRETKGTINPNLLQFPNEKRKIDCAKKHFAALDISYRQIDTKVIKYWLDVADNEASPEISFE